MGRPQTRISQCHGCGKNTPGCRTVGDFNICGECAPMYRERMNMHYLAGVAITLAGGPKQEEYKHILLPPASHYYEMGNTSGIEDRLKKGESWRETCGDILASIKAEKEWVPKCQWVEYAMGYADGNCMGAFTRAEEIKKIEEAIK